MSYESPIHIERRAEFETNIKKMAQTFDEAVEKEVYTALMQQHIYVDKEELIKALQYDRNQYEKGYADAVEEFKTQMLNGLEPNDLARIAIEMRFEQLNRNGGGERE